MNKTHRSRNHGSELLKDFMVEIADENDGFIVVQAPTADEAEKIAREHGYDVFYAHSPEEEFL